MSSSEIHEEGEILAVRHEEKRLRIWSQICPPEQDDTKTEEGDSLKVTGFISVDK